MTAVGSRRLDSVRLRPGRVGLGSANGTFGELLQGALPNAVDGEGRFLVTLPVARWSCARFEVGDSGSGLRVHPVTKTKAAALAASLLGELGHPAHGTLALQSTIPEGKGLASSSADLVATARAVMAAVRASVPLDRLGPLLARIEPTDGVLHDGIVAFDHRRGRHLAALGRLPGLQVVAVDQGGRVDTVAFNRCAPEYDAAERRHYARLLADLGAAVATHDLAAVGAIATESAVLNQTRMPNRNLGALRAVCSAVGGLGVVACHSGTMVGVLLDQRARHYRARLSEAVRMGATLPGQIHLYRTLAA